MDFFFLDTTVMHHKILGKLSLSLIRKDTSESMSNTPYLQIWINLILKQQINRWVKKSTTIKSPRRHKLKIPIP